MFCDYDGPMRLDISQTDEHLTFTAVPAEGDRDLAGKARLARRTASFKLPAAYNWEKTHPDLLALAGLITFYPWVGDRLELPFSVSRTFADIVMTATKIDIPHSTPWIPRRTTLSDAHPGLSFSGGVDSMAALAVMPEDTVPVFSLRSPPPSGARSLYKADVALHAVAEMVKAGKPVHVIESDHEWVREPVGFSVDPAPAVPLVLLADELNLDAVTFGTIAESAYLTGKGQWADYKNRVAYTRWRDLFEAVGLSFYNATAGISEIGTSTIVQTSTFGYLAQSCIRGVPGAPCRACVKCFRKSFITASLSGEWPDEALVSRMMANRTIKTFLEQSPIRFEIILTSVMRSYDGDDALLLALRTRVGADAQDVSFTHCWYPPASDLMPLRYQESTRAAMSRFLPEMNIDQIESFQNFNSAPFMESNKKEIDDFRVILEENAKQQLVL